MPEIEKSLVERHRANERALAEHMEEFVKVGQALMDIRVMKTYKLVDGYETFEAYCKEKWDFTKQHAYRLMDAAEIRMKLPSLPTSEVESNQLGDSAWNENQMRQLGRLKSPTKAKAVAERVVKEVKEKKTKGEKVKLGAIVRKHVDKELNVRRGRTQSAAVPMFDEVIRRWTGELGRVASEIEDFARENTAGLMEFAGKNPQLVKEFAGAIARLSRAWEVTSPPHDRLPNVREVV